MGCSAKLSKSKHCTVQGCVKQKDPSMHLFDLICIQLIDEAASCGVIQRDEMRKRDLWRANSLVEIISTYHTDGGHAETDSRIAHSDFQCLDAGNECDDLFLHSKSKSGQVMKTGAICHNMCRGVYDVYAMPLVCWSLLKFVEVSRFGQLNDGIQSLVRCRSFASGANGNWRSALLMLAIAGSWLVRSCQIIRFYISSESQNWGL